MAWCSVKKKAQVQLYFVRSGAFPATEYNKFLSGYQPTELYKHLDDVRLIIKGVILKITHPSFILSDPK
jgi:hypothetical protein